jgi:hypothetical protein
MMENKLYKEILEIEEWIGHENVSMEKQDIDEFNITIDYLICFFEEEEDYLKCHELKKISEKVSNYLCD